MILAISAGLLISGCADQTAITAPEKSQAIAVDVASATMREATTMSIGQQTTLWVSPAARTKSRSTTQPVWRSSNATVASVAAQQNGGQYAVVTGVANGAAYVTARTAAGTDSFYVFVGTGPAALRFNSAGFGLAVGDTARTVVQNAAGSVSFTSLNPSIAAVSATGLITALTAGQTRIRVVDALGAIGELPVTVTATVAPPPPVGGTRIAALLTRTSAGSGTVLVSSGIPLIPGALRDTDLGSVRVFVAGTEQRIFVSSLRGRHPDGSLATILVQFPYTLSAGTNVAAEIVLGSTRTLADLPAQTDNPSLPSGLILPSDPDYLVRTNLVGPTLTVAATTSISTFAAKFDVDFKTYADQHWAQSGDVWEQNYYDRAQVYYAHWVRTGNPEYWVRGTRQMLAYRTNYLEANNYGTSPHWSQMDGIAIHYQLTGDEKSRFAVGRVSEGLRYFRDNARIVGHPDIESRILARTLMAQLWGWRLQARGNEATATSAEISTLVSTILGLQADDGAWRYPAICSPNSGSLTYMDGMLNEALIQAFTHHSANAAILLKVRKSTDYMWSRWKVATQAVEYAPGCPPSSTDPNSYAELNNLVVNSFAWVYAQTGEAAFKQKADSVFNGGVRGQFLPGSKQFNQQYTTGYRYFFWRSAR
ncbi:Ig-like domain-containing protein [Gemmatimonas sp.]|uniref:Ig-like domain-containing protein n=1 Tax=Gemmatimonas sp. TaxID=1962908 RepID=UPI00286DB5AC|nr:Ig-like domain-containing protein [Gemmatimonas sp.]